MKVLMIVLLLLSLAACAPSDSGSSNAAAVSKLVGTWTLQTKVCDGTPTPAFDEILKIQSDGNYSITYVISGTCTLIISGTYTESGNTFAGNLTSFEPVGNCSGSNPALESYQDTFTVDSTTLTMSHIANNSNCVQTYTK